MIKKINLYSKKLLYDNLREDFWDLTKKAFIVTLTAKHNKQLMSDDQALP